MAESSTGDIDISKVVDDAAQLHEEELTWYKLVSGIYRQLKRIADTLGEEKTGGCGGCKSADNYKEVTL